MACKGAARLSRIIPRQGAGEGFMRPKLEKRQILAERVGLPLNAGKALKSVTA